MDDAPSLADIKALLGRFPSAMYPKPARVSDRANPTCALQPLLSLHEGCMHRRVWQGAPTRIGLRHDVLVSAPDLQQASAAFVNYLEAVVEAAAAEGNVVRGVLLSPGGAAHSSAAERVSSRRGQWWSLEKIRADTGGFYTAVKRATSSHHKVALEVTVRAAVPPAMLDGAYGTAAVAAAERGGGAMTTHFSVRIYFTLHHRVGNASDGARRAPGSVTEHYATLPFESLFTGVFFEEEAAVAYTEMFGAALTPTSPAVLRSNAERLIVIGLRAMRKDNLPRVLRSATLIMLLRGDMGWRGEVETLNPKP
jgi:hypothetical protein